METAELVRAVVTYFGGRRRAEHILTCDECGHDDGGRFQPCRRCPDAAGIIAARRGVARSA